MPEPDPGSFTRAFLGEIGFRALVVGIAMACSFLGSWLVGLISADASWVGAFGGLAIGIVLAVWVFRRRTAREEAQRSSARPPISTDD